MFKKVSELLNTGSIKEEDAKALDVEIQSELTKLRDEASSWRVKHKELQTTFNEVSESKKQLEQQVTGLDEKIAKAKEDGKAELVKSLETEKAEKNELVKKFNDMEVSNKNLKIENSLNKALGSYELIDIDMASRVLKLDLDVSDDKVSFKDGKSLEDGLKGFFEAKPHLLKAKGNGGSGKDNNDSGFAKDSLTAQKLAKLNNK